MAEGDDREGILEDQNMRSNQDEESDDDLLAPATFLYSGKKLAEIKTPQKVQTPEGNDLSPITPSRPDAECKKKRKKVKRLGFKQLIAGKAAKDEMDKALSKMNAELREGIKNGKSRDLFLSVFKN